MSDGNAFMALIDKAPYDKDKLIGQAVGWFLKRQEPDEVDFVEYKNGYQIRVYCDEGSSEEAKEFWQENIHPNLGGEQ